MQAIEKLKNEANVKFAANDVEGAIELYRSAAVAADGVEAKDEEEQKALLRLRAVLHSNAANALMTLQRYPEAAEEARAATSLDPTAVKAWVRLVQSQLHAGYPFDAYVLFLLHLRPVLRRHAEERTMTGKEVSAVLEQVEPPLLRELGLAQVSPDFELVPYAGGVAMISRRHFKPNEVIFVENKYTTSMEEMSLNVQKDLTTDKIAAHFARHLQPEQAANSDLWVRFKKQFHGAWPRSFDEIDEETRATVGSSLRELFPDLPGDAFDELLVTSLMCRYNCFHSGFFRTCALANHSCRANIAMKYSPRDETVTMITVSDIAPGELMNVKYLSDAHFMLGLGKRRELLRSWLFWCDCDRCAEDNQPAATQEQMQCPHCERAYVHLPTPGDAAALLQAGQTSANTTITEPDPLLRAEATCGECGQLLLWTPEQHSRFRESLPDFSASTAQSPAELNRWMGQQLERLEGLRLHPCHWAYRMLLYFYCVPLCGQVATVADKLLLSAPISGADHRSIFSSLQLEEHYKPLFALAKASQERHDATAGGSTDCPSEGHSSNQNNDKATPPIWEDSVLQQPGCGCEALQALVCLWHLIRPFYPMHEMWAVHLAVCQAVLLNLALQDRVADTPRLSNESALVLLTRHAHFIGSTEVNKWLDCFMRQKDRMKQPPPVARIKKALKK